MKKTIELLKMLGDETRLKILFLLGEQPRYVCELEYILGKSQPCISHHLKLLNAYGFVSYDKDGRWIRYSFRPDGNGNANRELMTLLKTLIPEEKRFSKLIMERMEKVNREGKESVCGLSAEKGRNNG